MTIPPELAALQRYGWYHEDTKRAAIGPDVNGHLLKYDDVARAWPQRASGEAKPVVWQYRVRVNGNHEWSAWTDTAKGHYDMRIETPHADTEMRELFTHPAATSAQVAIYFCSGPSGSIWALDESEIEPTIKQFAEAHGDDPGEYTATPFYSKPADTSALRELVRKIAFGDYDDISKIESEARKLLAGEGNE